jgi:DNA-binding LacI/PurR family transcriptional regulator
MPSIKDVAAHAGVSISTVSHVIRNTKFVSDELRERIQASIEELGYEVNPIASSLKSRSTRTIGLIITNIHRIFFPRLIRGVQDTLGKAGYDLVLYDSDDDVNREEQFIRQLTTRWVDGIIVDSVADEERAGYFRRLARLGSRDRATPVVSIERNLRDHGIDSVVVDNQAGGRIVTEHLVGKGCRHVAFISGPGDSCMVRERLAGCRKALAALGPSAEPIVVPGDFSPQSGYMAMRELIARDAVPEGVFAANDQMAIGAIKALRETGRRIPEDVCVAGFDDSFVASIVEPALTTVYVPKYQIGQTAAELLLGRIDDPETDAQLVELPVNLIVRKSTELRGEGNWDLVGW